MRFTTVGKMKAIWILTVLCFVDTQGQIPGLGKVGKALKDSTSSITEKVNNIKDYSDYIAQSGKSYGSTIDKALREQAFTASKAVVDSHNKLYESGKETFKLGFNKLSDIPKAEFLKRFTSVKKSEAGEQKAAKNRKAFPDSKQKQPLPDSFDWRDQGFNTPVRYQGECGSCWAFGAIQSIEGHYFVKNKKNINLSVQNLVDCSSDYGNEGCDGGYQEYAFGYILENKGIASEAEYPYKYVNETCQYKESNNALSITAYSTIAPKNENLMKKVIATRGPLVCSVYASPDTFRLYQEGIYNDEECSKEEVNHAILVVGYGVDKDGNEFWTIKNSWDSDWGEKGYMRIPRNKNSFCGIADECSFPVL